MTENLKKKPPTFLANKNAHQRDAYISFEEEEHIYTIHGIRGEYCSATTFIASLFQHFDADKIIDTMIAKGKLQDPENQYYGMTREEIKKQWNDKGKLASGFGTQTHANIEYFYNNEEINDDSIEYKYFLQFWNDNKHLEAYRTEWMVFYEEAKICGSIDMVFYNTLTKKYEIWDWKRVPSSKIEKTQDSYGKYAIIDEISHIPDTKYWHYCIQLNIYKKILQDKYGLEIDAMNLVSLHPDNTNYLIVPVQDLQDDINNLFEKRIAEFSENKTIKMQNKITKTKNKIVSASLDTCEF